MQALQSFTRHQLVMDSLSLDHDSVSEPGDSPTQLLSRPPFTPTYRRRSSPLGLRRTQSLQDGLFQHHTPYNQHHQLVRTSSRFELCRTETRRLTSWSEYAVRRTLVRFRTRKAALKNSLRRLSGQRRVPSQTIKAALDNEYEVCKSATATHRQKLVAVFFCWFYRWIMDLYYHLTEDGTERSFSKWVLATLLVTSGAILVIALASFALLQVNFLLLLLLNAGVLYVTMLMGFLVCILGVLAIVNFD